MWHLFESVLVLLGVALRYIRLHLPTFASAVTVPIASASPPPPRSQARNMYLFEQTVTVLFITDCTLELQYGVHGSLRVGDPLGSNRSNYLSGCWFWIDFPSSVPVELIDYAWLSVQDISLPPETGEEPNPTGSDRHGGGIRQQSWTDENQHINTRNSWCEQLQTFGLACTVLRLKAFARTRYTCAHSHTRPGGLRVP